MAIGLTTPQNLLAVEGIRLGVAAAGIRYADRNDLVLVEIAEGSQCAAVFTKNAFCAAPVVVCRQHLAISTPRFLVINSGNANAGLGEAGMQASKDCCAAVAELGDCSTEQVLPFSTGVIGENFPTQT
ncbi:MAG: bifunctional ornithine acetyltransferase/N-acetylglutamate synthase, partial [Sulfuriflexus sp.]|nr:bifunctional ornithine acetyltransferase/N-acetylglutamate synthase [Sulfuriflexus sp.]